MTKPNLLIIDDNLTARETLIALLTGSGYEILSAGSGQEGLEIAAKVHPEVILLDVMMPGMDGFEVCRKMRQDQCLAEVPIIMVTALDDRDSKLMGLESGADDFISKPYDSMELTIRLKGLQQVARYRHLLEEREKLEEVLAKLERQNAELKSLSAKVIEVQEAERRRLAIELHDDLGQLLTGLKMTLEERPGGGTQGNGTAHALEIVQELLRKIRDLTLDLRPAMLDDLGLFAALDWFFRRYTNQTNIRVIHNIDPLEEKRFPGLVENNVFRLIQEALTNVARHAGVTEVTVNVNLEPQVLSVSIIDAGKGFDLETLEPGQSTGLSGMRERVNTVGGSYRISTAMGEGTIIEAEFPIQVKER